MTKTRLPVVFAAAALLALLTACGPGSPAPTPTGTADAGPSAEPTPEPPAAADRPEPRFGDGCDALVPDALLSAIFPFAVEPHDFLATEYAAWPGIPRHGAVAQVGGLLCEWSNGEPYSSMTGASAFRGIQLSVLPEAEDGWDTLLGMHGYGRPEGDVYCSPSASICTFDVYASGYWFAAEIAVPVSAGTPAAVDALADHLLTQVAGFGALQPLWEPADLVRPPHDCAVVLPASVVDAIHGRGHTLYESDGGGGWSLWAEALTRNTGFGCGWFDETRGIGVEWQNGGAWLAEHLRVTTNGVAIDIPALGSDGIARLTCYAGGECRADLVVHGTWISATVSNSADPEAGVRLLAAHLAGLMTG
jgi:hypothetical protein